MADVLYTSTEKVRAVLGLSSVELEEAYLADINLEDMLLLELEDVYPDHEALFAAIGGTPTADETRTWRILQLYCTHRAATFLLPQFQMIVDKRRSDGDFQGDRFGADLEAFRNHIKAEADRYQNLLNPDLTFVLNPFGAVDPDYDPVTNEGA